MQARISGWRVAAIAVSLCVAAHADAQPRPRHAGLNIAFAVGQGVLNTACATCNAIANERAGLITMRAGWTLHDLAIVVAEGTLLSRSVPSGVEDRPIETSYQALTLSAMAYGGKHSEAFIKFGGGFARGKRNVQLSTDTLRSYMKVTNPVLRFGAGVDMRFGRTWSLTPVVEYILSFARTSDAISFRPLDNRTTPGVKAKNNLLVFALGLTFP